MKKILLLVAAVATLSLFSCGGNATKTDAADSAAIVADEVAAEAQPGVIDLKDDAMFRPDTKVDQLTILDFNAVWCGPCKMLHPVFEEAAKQYADIKFYSVDIDTLPQTAQAFGVEAVPTVVFLKPDGTSQTFVGTEDLLPADKFDKLVNENK